MTAQVTVDQAAREAFKAVQVRPRADHGGNTQRLLVVYAIESFLRVSHWDPKVLTWRP